jgi:hypothetical protein
MSDDTTQQPYGGITDPEALAWLQRNYPAPKKSDNGKSETGESRARGSSLWR